MDKAIEMVMNANEPVAQEPTDSSLIVEIRDGSEAAATQLYDRYARRLFGLVKSQMGSRLRSTTEPEDIVQSVFKSVFRGVQSGGYDAPPGDTLWNLVAVIAVHKLRKTASRQTAQCRDVARSVPLNDVGGQLQESAPTMESIEASVRETLDLLRDGEREVVLLRVQGYSVEEISEKLGRSRRTIERNLQRSRQRLAAVLELQIS